MSEKLHMREVPHQTVVGSLDDVAGIMRSVQDLGVQANSPPGPDIYCCCSCVHTMLENTFHNHLWSETSHALIVTKSW